jgi:hypothetical protein
MPLTEGPQQQRDRRDASDLDIDLGRQPVPELDPRVGRGLDVELHADRAGDGLRRGVDPGLRADAGDLGRHRSVDGPGIAVELELRRLTGLDETDHLLGEARSNADLRIGREDGAEPLSVRDEIPRSELDHVDEPPRGRCAVVLLVDLILETIDRHLQLSKLALAPELLALEPEELGGERLAPHGLLALEPDDRQALRSAGVGERVDLGAALELLELGDGAGRALLGELRALLGQPVPGRDLPLLLHFLADRHLVDQAARGKLVLLVGELSANDGELLLGRRQGGLALLELELLAPRVELDEQVTCLDLFVEVEHRAYHPTRCGRLEPVDRVVRLDAALGADLHHGDPGAEGPGDEASDTQRDQDDQQDSGARLVSVQGPERPLEWICHWVINDLAGRGGAVPPLPHFLAKKAGTGS